MRKAFIRKIKTLRWQYLLWRKKSHPKLGILGLRGKTLWDLAQLLIVPAVLAIAALWFNQSQQVRTESVEATRISEQRSIEAARIAEQRSIEATRISEQQRLDDDKAKEQNFQNYLDDLTDLLTNKNLRTTSEEAEVRTIARAKTLATLRTLDGERKGLLVQFLYESNLIQGDKEVISLKGANLSEANLSRADLFAVDLNEANLSRANLSGASLSYSDLNAADLSGADLRGADLRMADLRKAKFDASTLIDAKWRLVWEILNQQRAKRDLRGVNLFLAYLDWADLSGANMAEAHLGLASLGWADLSGADLRGADLMAANLGGANLSGANLRGANLIAANLIGASLDGADLSWVQVSNKQLAQAKSLEGATMPDRKVYDPAFHRLPTPMPTSTPIETNPVDG